MRAEICAVLERANTNLHEQSGELWGEVVEEGGRLLTPATVGAVLLLAQQAELPDISLLPKLGVKRLYLLEHPWLEHYSTERYVAALAWFIQQHTPMLVATSATPNGRDWAPRLAARLGLPFVPNCLGLNSHDDGL